MSQTDLEKTPQEKRDTAIGAAILTGTLLLGGVATSSLGDGAEAEKTVQTEPVEDTVAAPAPAERTTHTSDIGDVLEGELDTNVDRLLNDTHREDVRQTFAEISQYRDLIDEAADITGLDEAFITSYLAVESAGSLRIHSRAGAAGIAQFMPSTARDRGMEINDFVDERYDPRIAIKESAEYYEDLIDEFGSKKMALIAYNWGPNNTRRLQQRYGTDWEDIEPHLYFETRNYVIKALSREKLIEQGFEYDQRPLLSGRQEAAQQHKIQEGETLYSIGQQYSVDIDRIQELNPRITDFDNIQPGYHLYIPPSQNTVRLADAE